MFQDFSYSFPGRPHHPACAGDLLLFEALPPIVSCSTIGKCEVHAGFPRRKTRWSPCSYMHASTMQASLHSCLVCTCRQPCQLHAFTHFERRNLQINACQDEKSHKLCVACLGVRANEKKTLSQDDCFTIGLKQFLAYNVLNI